MRELDGERKGACCLTFVCYSLIACLTACLTTELLWILALDIVFLLRSLYWKDWKNSIVFTDFKHKFNRVPVCRLNHSRSRIRLPSTTVVNCYTLPQKVKQLFVKREKSIDMERGNKIVFEKEEETHSNGCTLHLFFGASSSNVAVFVPRPSGI